MAGNESDQPPPDTEPPPEDPFALVGHEIRAGIIQVLARGDHVVAHGNELSLSDLRSRLDIDVDPSHLHYHLQQLVGHFVKKIDDGYQLNSVGYRLSLNLCAGTLDHRKERMTVAANFDCYYCQEPVEARFDKGHARIECPGCEHLYMRDYYILPVTAFADEAAAFWHFSRYMISRILSLGLCVCPSCGNSLAPEFDSHEENHNLKVKVNHLCNSCGAVWWQSVGMALLADPGLIAFCYDHGIDILSTPHWELEFAATDKRVTVHTCDPWEVALEVTFDGDSLELVVDGDLNVLERNRLDATREGHPSLLSRIQSGACTTGGGGRGDVVILPDNADCLEYLRHHRWSDGVTCPRCERQDTIKKGTTGKDAKRYRCQNCGGTFNDLTGTIFADHRLTLAEMFYIIRQMDETTTAEIARQLDRSSESISDFIREVRDAQEADTVVGR